MNAVKLILNALVIGALNLASFVIGLFIFKLGAAGDQRPVQGTAALVIAVVLVVTWLVLFRKINRLEVETDFIRVFLLVFPCTPVIFIPVHYLVTGYLTGLGNLAAVAAYQLPMNLLAVAIAAGVIRKRKKAPRGALSSES
jgi:hypothetical protein